jgi:ABC-type branched-subunit amino acid transport system substrate-binding protein
LFDVCVASAVALSVCGASAAPKAEGGAPIVIGQSLPSSGAWTDAALSIRAGAEAAVRAVNAAGGIHGKQVELLTVDDQGVPANYVTNIKALVKDKGAIATLNCVADASCRAGIALAGQLQTPLVGIMAGTPPAPGRRGRYVIRVRPSYEREVAAMVKQLKSMQIPSVAMVRMAGDDEEQSRIFEAALVKGDIKVGRYVLEGKGSAAFDKMLAELAKGGHRAAFLDVSPSVLYDMEANKIGARPEWPSMVLALASPITSQLALLMKPRIVGYTTVVPNPDRMSMQIVAQFQDDVDAYSTPEALRFEGFEAYLNTRILLDAIRKTSAPLTPQRIAATFDGMGVVTMGGFRLDMSPDKTSASDYLDLGVTTREGMFVR